MPPPFDSWATDSQVPVNRNPHPSLQSSAPKNKKPRHRHSPVQLAALNELFDRNEHPPLEQRTALADRLGMETKTVNAWFQNKRASSKKRVRGGAAASYESHHINTPPVLHSSSTPQDFHRHQEIDDIHDDEYSSLDIQHSRSVSVIPSDYPSSFYSGHSDQAHFYTESDNMPRRMRMRPSSEQADELKKLYNINPHPTTEQRQALSATIGMRYQSITNWFQNQRSLAKKRKEDDPEPSLSFPAPKAEYPHETRQYSAFPPPSHSHPSLGLPPPTSHPSLLNGSILRRSRSASPFMEDRSPRRSSSRRSTTPYGSNTSASFNRPRRSRPEPYQLDALKELFSKTSTPTIEERSALALEIGMDVGKVTNWFRNLRQMARKRAKKSGSGDDEDEDRDPYSASASRFGTPSFGSSSSSMNDDSMDMDAYDYDVHLAHSDNGSEDEYQEAVTPSPGASPSPPPTASVTTSRSSESYSSRFDSLNLPFPIQLDKVSEKQFSGIKVEDALLLLSFHHHIVH